MSKVQLTDIVKNNSNNYFDYASTVETNRVITNFKIDTTAPGGIDTTKSGGETLQAMVFQESGLSITFIHLNNLIQAKKAVGRHKDLDDIEKLTSGK